MADVVGSTSQMLNAVINGEAQEYIVATDNGILHRMRQLAPGKTLIEAPTAGNSATCKSCAHCPWMAMNSLQGLVDCLENGTRRHRGGRARAREALGCIQRMLDFVAANPAAIAQAREGQHRRHAGPRARHRRRLNTTSRRGSRARRAGIGD